MPLNVRDTFPLTHAQAVNTLAGADWNRLERVRLMEASFDDLRLSIGGALKTYWFLDNPTFPLPRHYQACYGLGCQDDMVRLILKNFMAELRNLNYEIYPEVQLLRKYWTDQGMDPLTLERLS